MPMYECPSCFGVFDDPIIIHYEQLTIDKPEEHHEFRCPYCRSRLVHESDLNVFNLKIKAYKVVIDG